MNCIDYRRLITSEPAHAGTEAKAHRLSCQSCAAFAEQTAQFDARLKQAMSIKVPAGLESRVMLAATSQKTKAPWLAAAAAVLLVIGAGLFLFNSYTDEDLPGHVIEHLYHEAQLLVPTATELVPAPRLRQVLARTGVILNEEVQSVVHAGVCYFRGHLVSHLVVNSDNGPVTVLLLPDEKVDEATEIDEDGFRGVIMPVRGGSIAVIGSGSYPEKVERIFTRAVEWQT